MRGMSSSAVEETEGQTRIRNTEVFEYNYDYYQYFIERKIISGVKNKSNDKGTGHMRKETRDDENEKDNENGDTWWRRSGNETK